MNSREVLLTLSLALLVQLKAFPRREAKSQQRKVPEHARQGCHLMLLLIMPHDQTGDQKHHNAKA